MRWSIVYLAVLATLLAATCYAGGLPSDGDQTYLAPTSSNVYEIAAIEPVSAIAEFAVPGGYDPYGPQIYSSWNSSRCYQCMGVWAGYGCHEFKGPKRAGCRTRKFGSHGYGHGCASEETHCTTYGCATMDTPPDSAPSEPPDAEQPAEPPMPSEEKAASRSAGWSEAWALFPFLNPQQQKTELQHN